MDNKETNKTLILVLIAILALCGCMIISCCAAAVYSMSRMNRDTIIEFLSNGTETLPSLNDPDSSSGMQSEEEVQTAEGLTSEEQKIISITEEIRGITAENKLAPIYKSSDELRQDLISDLQEVTDEEFAEELGLYKILGFAPDDFDLRQFYVDLYTEQIAGFYDPEENAMYLIADISQALDRLA